MPEQDIKEETFKISPALPGWIGAIICFFMAFVYLFIAPLVSIWLILAGTSIFPPFWKKVKAKWKYSLPTAFKIVLCVVFFFVAAVITPKTHEPSLTTNEQTPTTIVTISDTPAITSPSEITAAPTKDMSYHAPATNISGYPNLNKVLINASITTNSEGILFRNNEKQQWYNCIATIDPDSGSSNWYEYDFGSIPAGQSYMTQWNQLIREDGTKYTNISKEAKIIQLSCELGADTIGFARVHY